MKKIVLLLVTCLFSFGISIHNAGAQAQNPTIALQEKQQGAEARLDAKQRETLARIDAQIAKAKAAGKPTTRLERKRADVLNRISAKKKRA